MTAGRRRPAAGAIAALAALLCAAAARADDLVFDMAVLRGLDKVTGRVQVIDAPVNTTVHFGTLDIVARTCRKKPPEDLPEASAFLDIAEENPAGGPTQLFRGWMFASSPALDALENPVYDIWVIDCANSADNSPPPAAAAPPGSSR